MLEIIKFKKVLSQLFIFMYYNFFEKEWTCLNHFILEFRFNQSFDLHTGFYMKCNTGLKWVMDVWHNLILPPYL